jgi:dihydroxy-acid dehydratase
VPARSLHLHVEAQEMERRRAVWVAPAPHATRGWAKLYVDHVLQADRGVDLDFLVGRTGSPIPRDNH